MARKKGLALALSGGSVAGFAHIGFLEVLEEHHIPIEHIVGTSMGAMIGGIYAAGKLSEFKKKVLELSRKRIYSFFMARRLKKGGSDVREFEKILREFIDKKKIEDLDIGFTATATDLKTGKEIYIEKGKLIDGILASISIPGIFNPLKKKGMMLVDGGVVDPLPRSYAHKIARKVIAVNAMAGKTRVKKKMDIFDILSASVNILTKKLIGLDDGSEGDELFIQIDTKHINSFDISKIPKAIRRGRKAGKKNIKKIIRFVRR